MYAIFNDLSGLTKHIENPCARDSECDEWNSAREKRDESCLQSAHWMRLWAHSQYNRLEMRDKVVANRKRTLRFKRNADEFTLYLLQTVRQTIQKTSLPAIFPIEQVESVARRQLCRRSRGRSARLPRPWDSRRTRRTSRVAKGSAWTRPRGSPRPSARASRRAPTTWTLRDDWWDSRSKVCYCLRHKVS